MVFIFLDSNRWSEIKDSNGSLPNGRCAHSGVALGKKIIILGGMSPDPPSVLESTYIFDTGVKDLFSYL
jgi:hypothetical protein